VRTKPELLYVGGIPGAVAIEWQSYPGSRPNPEFIGELAALTSARVREAVRAGGVQLVSHAQLERSS